MHCNGLDMCSIKILILKTTLTIYTYKRKFLDKIETLSQNTYIRDQERERFGFQPDILFVTQISMNEIILLSKLDRTFLKQFASAFQFFLFHDKN